MHEAVIKHHARCNPTAQPIRRENRLAADFKQIDRLHLRPEEILERDEVDDAGGGALVDDHRAAGDFGWSAALQHIDGLIALDFVHDDALNEQREVFPREAHVHVAVGAEVESVGTFTADAELDQ